MLDPMNFPVAWWGLALLGILLFTANGAAAEAGARSLQSLPAARFQFGGFAGRRIQANIENWLLPAPLANPGLFEMFALRDRDPAPKLVPWAGEFAGKYLISAIQALRMSTDAELERTAREMIKRLIASQAEDGYLGPFRKEERLLGHWDLWGHYHCLLALLMWHEQTEDTAALDCARRAGDLVCRTFLGTGKRAFDAGSDEMNLSIIHALGWLHRVTREVRYLQMIRELEKDWERGGDFLRAGLEGKEFFQTPRPRWESLHSLQGLAELWLITGDEKYRRAFEHHWRSIARWDLRNTGGFSSGEQATGNPYAPSAIETCCSIAWMALSCDMLNLTGDSRAADALELATFNAWAGAQHPSGRWCAYSTPMDGMREASAHSIVFQSRHGTPELNCCSVNGPRGWGMLSEWAVMAAPDGYAVNWFGPFEASLGSGESLRVEGEYPVEAGAAIIAGFERELALAIRIPEWSENTSVRLNGEPLAESLAGAPQPGRYLAIHRAWRKGDRVDLQFDLRPRAVPGAKEAVEKVSVYCGPVLLAWDQKFNSFDETGLPALDAARLAEAQRVAVPEPEGVMGSVLQPLVLLDVPAAKGRMRLCDFASAGASGTRYRSWLAATNSAPAPVVTRFPRDGISVARGTVAFRWTAPQYGTMQALEIAEDENFSKIILARANLDSRETLVELGSEIEAERWHYWRIVSRNESGMTASSRPFARFKIDPNLPRAAETLAAPRRAGPKMELLRASLHEDPEPEFGELRNARDWKKVADGTGLSLNGVDQRLVYGIGAWPEENYSVSLLFRLRELPEKRLGQVVSAWAGPQDDPLRAVIENGRLFARLEAAGGFSTEGVPVTAGKWHKLAVVKSGSSLLLYLDGKKRASCMVPEYIATRATDFALGGNPHFTGNEFLAADFAELAFYPFALQFHE